MPDLNETIDDIVDIVHANTSPMQPDSIERPQIAQNLVQRRKYMEWNEFPSVIDDALAVAVKEGRLERIDDATPRYSVP